MNILLTGANGFLGRHVVEELLKQNFQVRVLVRSKHKIEQYPWAKKVEIFEGDLRFCNNLVSSFDQIDLLIHLAACKKGDEEEQFESTVVGTENLLEAMSRSKTRRLIFLSSLSVYDYKKINRELTETSPLDSNNYNRDGYAITKLWQEKVVRKESKKNTWDLTVLRPGMVWGEKEEYPLVLSIPFGKFHFVIGPMKQPNLVHVKSCSRAIVDSITNTQTIGETFNIVDNDHTPSWSLVGKYLKTTNTLGIRIPIPYYLSYHLIKGIYSLSRLFLKEDLKIPSVFIPCRFEARFKPFTCSQEKSELLLNGSSKNEET